MPTATLDWNATCANRSYCNWPSTGSPRQARRGSINSNNTLKKLGRLSIGVFITISTLIVLCINVDTAFRTNNMAANGLLFHKPQTAFGETHVSDFVTLYAAGLLNERRLTGQIEANTDIYDPFLTTQLVEHLVAPWHPAEVYSIQYPPLFFLLLTPVAFFDLQKARMIWAVMIYVCMTGSFLLLAREEKIKSKMILLAGAIIAIGNYPVLNLLYGGQTTAFELFFLVASLLSLKHNKPFQSGLLAGLALLKIHFSPMAIIPGLCLGRLKFAYGLLVTVALEAILSTIIVGPLNVFNFVRTNYLCEITHTYSGHNNPQNMSNLRASLAMLMPQSHLVTPVVIAVFLLVCLLSLFLWLKVYPALLKKTALAFELTAATSIMLLLVCAPHAYSYDYVLLLAPATFIYAWADRKKGSGMGTDILRWSIMAAVIAASLVPLAYMIPLPFVPALVVHRAILPVYLLILLALTFAAINCEKVGHTASVIEKS